MSLCVWSCLIGHFPRERMLLLLMLYNEFIDIYWWPFCLPYTFYICWILLWKQMQIHLWKLKWRIEHQSYIIFIQLALWLASQWNLLPMEAIYFNQNFGIWCDPYYIWKNNLFPWVSFICLVLSFLILKFAIIIQFWAPFCSSTSVLPHLLQDWLPKTLITFSVLFGVAYLFFVKENGFVHKIIWIVEWML